MPKVLRATDGTMVVANTIATAKPIAAETGVTTFRVTTNIGSQHEIQTHTPIPETVAAAQQAARQEMAGGQSANHATPATTTRSEPAPRPVSLRSPGARAGGSVMEAAAIFGGAYSD
jgi:hypothetical protein